MAECTKCGGTVATYCYQGVTFDICKQCQMVIVNEENFIKLAKFIDSACEITDIFELNPFSAKEEIRICPNCKTDMKKIFNEGVLLDRCDKCRQIMFDNGELSKYFNKFVKTPIEIMSNSAFIKTYCKQFEKKGNNSDIYVKNKNESKGNILMKIQSKETEKTVPSSDGWGVAGIILIAIIMVIIFFALAGITGNPLFFILNFLIIPTIMFMLGGFKILAPQEALVFTLFGKYYGTLRTPGFYWLNPFASSMFGKISLKARTLDNGKQKINDALGNPIEVGIMVTWEVRDTAKALFNVNDYVNFLSAQCDSSLRNIVRLYPYDAPDDSEKQSLKGDSAEISEKLKSEIQERVVAAGLNILDARITHLAYSPEIAAAMLQRQQANAVLDAKRTIVEGAVGMVEMAIDKLSNNKNITLDDNTKASMVNNLLVVLCSNKESQPVVRNDRL